MRISIRKKLILTNFFLLFVVGLIASIITTRELRHYYKNRILEQLKTHLDGMNYLLENGLLEIGSSPSPYEMLRGYADASHFRLTLIDSTGRLLFDSELTADSLRFAENHINRPEVQMAKEQGFGSNERWSATIDMPQFYAARRFELHGDDPAAPRFHGLRYIRVSLPQVEIERILGELQWKIFAGVGLAALIIATLSFWLSSKLTAPIQQLTEAAESVKQGNLEAHFQHKSKDEIGELADLLNEMVAKLREDLVKMRRLQTMRSQFLGNVSHELRTPIFALQGYLETLLESNIADPAKQRQFLEKAYLQSMRLNSLLTDLIDISRIESGEMKMSFRYFNLNQWLAKLVNELTPKAGEKNVVLRFGQSQSFPHVLVLGDQDRLTQVMVNLIQNAIKYNMHGGTVDIGFAESGGDVRIYVSDTGQGIPEEHLPRIFERFYRVDKERSRAVGGTGLGLAIVKHIVEAHGSKIHVESKVGHGSVFSFVLKKKNLVASLAA